MKPDDFITNVALQFDETDNSLFTMETNFRDLDEWSSLTALAVLNMLNKKYGVKLSFADMRHTNTLQELYDLVHSRF